MKLRKTLNSLLLCTLITGCSAKSPVRKSAVAGMFYPKGENELNSIINGFLKNTPKQKVNGEVIALILPHAGYVFSGKTASFGYKLIEGKKINTVVILGPSHRFPIRYAAVFKKGYFETPLGSVEIDKNISKKLIKSSRYIEHNEKAHINEHSIEVQLPFLQKVLRSFKIVPILINNTSLEVCRNIAQAIKKEVKNKKVLVIASSDMSHYPSYKDANYVDNLTLKTILKDNPSKLIKLEKTILGKNFNNLNCILCGEAAVITTMYLAKELGADKTIKIHYSNSGDTKYGNKDKVVGYGVVAFIKPKKEGGSMGYLEEKELKELLKIARESLKEYFSSGKINERVYKTESKKLLKNGAAFVTLTINGHLRGCIGTTIARKPLNEVVAEMAISSAINDPRFRPLTKEEFDKVKIEISVLSPLKRVNSSDEIKMGTHGVVVRKGFHSGLFLPQVATETGWSKEKFLSELCSQKAGLSPNAWKDKDTELYIFTVDKISE